MANIVQGLTRNMFSAPHVCLFVFSACLPFFRVTHRSLPSLLADIAHAAMLSCPCSGVIDPEYPEFCANTQSSVSALHVYQGVHLPDRYQNRLFVGDYSKVCTLFVSASVRLVFFVRKDKTAALPRFPLSLTPCHAFSDCFLFLSWAIHVCHLLHRQWFGAFIMPSFVRY